MNEGLFGIILLLAVISANLTYLWWVVDNGCSRIANELGRMNDRAEGGRE